MKMNREEIMSQLNLMRFNDYIYLYSSPYTGHPKWRIILNKDCEAIEMNTSQINAFLLGFEVALGIDR